MNNINDNNKWYSEEYGFFGELYIEGDNSQEGYLTDKKLTIAERTQNDVDGVENLLKLKGVEKILDVPCGYGRHSIELAKRGYNVTGIDINSIHLKRAQKDIKKNGLKVNLIKKDMASIDYHTKFDVIINMCYSFGFYETDGENLNALKKFYRALKPNGKFLMETDVNIPYVNAGKFKESETRSLFSGNKLEIIEKFDKNTRRMNGSWTIIKSDGTRICRNYSVRVYEKEEFIKMCLEAGFKKCTAYANWKGASYKNDKQLIIFVAEK